MTNFVTRQISFFAPGISGMSIKISIPESRFSILTARQQVQAASAYVLYSDAYVIS